MIVNIFFFWDNYKIENNAGSSENKRKKEKTTSRISPTRKDVINQTHEKRQLLLNVVWRK